MRGIYDVITGKILRLAGYQRRAVLVGTGEHIEAVAHAIGDHGAPINVVGFISLTPRPDNGLRSLGDLDEISRIVERAQGRRGHHRRPRVPAAGGGRARRRVPPARRPRPRRAVDDGDPHPPRGVRPGPVGAAVRAQAAGLRGRRLRDEADLRHRRGDAAAARVQPGDPHHRRDRLAHLARAGLLPLAAPRHRRRAVRLPEVPHDVPRRRPAPGGPRVAQRGRRRDLQDPRRPAPDPDRPASCAASRSTSCPSS